MNYVSNSFYAMLAYALFVAIGNVTTKHGFPQGFHPVAITWAYLGAMFAVASIVLIGYMVYFAMLGHSFRLPILGEMVLVKGPYNQPLRMMPWFAIEWRLIIIIGISYYVAERMLTYSLTANELNVFQVTTIGMTVPVFTILVELAVKYFILKVPVTMTASRHDIMIFGLVFATIVAIITRPQVTNVLGTPDTLQAMRDKGCPVPQGMFQASAPATVTQEVCE